MHILAYNQYTATVLAIQPLDKFVESGPILGYCDLLKMNSLCDGWLATYNI